MMVESGGIERMLEVAAEMSVYYSQVGNGARDAYIPALEGVPMRGGQLRSDSVEMLANRRPEVDAPVFHQVAVAHEAGHLLGLLDEYSPIPPQEKADWDKLLVFLKNYNELLQEAGDEAHNIQRPEDLGNMNTDSIMSNGMKVERLHYLPLLRAVHSVVARYSLIEEHDWVIA